MGKITIDQALRIAGMQHISMIMLYAYAGDHFKPWYTNNSRLQFVQDYRQFIQDMDSIKSIANID